MVVPFTYTCLAGTTFKLEKMYKENEKQFIVYNFDSNYGYDQKLTIICDDIQNSVDTKVFKYKKTFKEFLLTK